MAFHDWEALEAWGYTPDPGHLKMDLGLAAATNSTTEARLRAAYGISGNANAFAEGWATFGQEAEAGAEVGVQVRW